MTEQFNEASATDLQKLMSALATNLMATVTWDRFALTVVDAEQRRLWDLYIDGVPVPGRDLGRWRPLDGTLTQLVCGLGGRGAWFDDRTWSEHPVVLEALRSAADVGLRSALSVPVTLEGAIVGVIHLRSLESGRYDDRAVEIVAQAAAEVSGRLLIPILRHVEAISFESQVWGRIVTALSTSGSGQRRFEEIAAATGNLIPFETFAISESRRSGEEFEILYLHGELADGLRVGSVVPASGTLTGHAMASRVPVVADMNDPVIQERFRTSTRYIIRRHALLVPVVFGDAVCGTLGFGATAPFEAGHVKTALRLASQVAPALIESRHRAIEARDTAERRSITEFALSIASQISLERMFPAMAERLQPLIPFDRLTVTEVLPDQKKVKYLYVTGIEVPGFATGDLVTLGYGRSAITMSQHGASYAGIPIEVQGVDLDPIVSAGLNSYLEAPIQVGGRRLGYISLRSRAVDAYDERTAELLALFGTLIGQAFENARLGAHLAEEARVKSVVSDILARLSRCKTVDDVWETLATELGSIVQYDRIVVSRYTDDGSEVVFVLGGDQAVARGTRAPLDALGVEVRERGYRIVDPSLKSWPEITRTVGLSSWIEVRFGSGEGPFGSVGLGSRGSYAYTREQAQLLRQVFLRAAGVVSEKALAEERARLARTTSERDRSGLERMRLADAMETKRRFIGMVSHELKSPLSVVLTFIDLLRRERLGAPSEKNAAYLEVIARNADRLKTMIVTLLDTARHDESGFSLTLSEVNPEELLKELVADVQPMLFARSQPLTLQIADRLPSIRADRDAIREVVHNLVTNASKYSPEGGRVELGSSMSGGELTVWVKDCGMGISAEDQKHLFMPFFRARSGQAVAEVPGTGLGLYFSRVLVELHGGRIDVESELQLGTVVTVRLPTSAGPTEC